MKYGKQLLILNTFLIASALTFHLLEANDGNEAIIQQLNAAIKSANSDAVNTIIKNNPKFNISTLDETHNTALHVAAKIKSTSPAIDSQITKIMEQLIGAGANVNATNFVGNTPLITAADYGHSNQIKLLIAAKANIDTQNRLGETALIKAVSNREIDEKDMMAIVIALLQAGANPNLKSGNKETAYEIARYTYPRIANLIKEASEKRKKEKNEKPLTAEEKEKLIEQGQAKEKLILQALDFQPNSLEQTIFDLAKAKKYDEITALVEKTTDPNELKRLTLMQLTIAQYIIDRTKFDMNIKESQVHRYVRQTLIKTYETDTYEAIQVQWLYLIQESIHELNKQLDASNLILSLNRPLSIINDILLDLGSLKHTEKFDSVELVKKTIAQNFKQLFDRLSYVMLRKSSGQLELLKKEISKVGFK